MTNLHEIRLELADILEVSIEVLQPELVLEADGNWDSLAKVSTIALIIEKTGQKSSLDEMDALTCIQDLYDLITTKMDDIHEIA